MARFEFKLPDIGEGIAEAEIVAWHIKLGDRALHLDRRLVGHHVGELLVFLDAVAQFDVPGDDLGLGDAFTDVGQLELIGRH